MIVTGARRRALCLVLLGISVVMCPWAEAIELRYHGYKMDDKNRLVIEQVNGEVQIILESRTRPEGGGPVTTATEISSTEPGRLSDREVLAHVRSEALKAAAPNYFQNAAVTYRIVIQGVSVLPGYTVYRTVPAGEARGVIQAELLTLAAQADGLRRDALYHSIPLVLNVLKEARRLPSPIPESVKEGLVGRIRVDEQTLERRKLEAGRRLGPMLSPATPTTYVGGAKERKEASRLFTQQGVGGGNIGSTYVRQLQGAGPKDSASALKTEAGKGPASQNAEGRLVE